MWKKLYEKLKKPTVKMLVVTYSVTLFAIVLTLVMLIFDAHTPPLNVLAYAVYALAAILLAYSVYTIIATKSIQRLVKWGRLLLKRRPLTEKLLENYDFRTLFFATFSLSLTVFYAGYNIVVAATGGLPVWHLSLAGYYVFLVCMRIGVLLYRRKERSGKTERVELTEFKQFRSCGILLVLVILALSVAIAQMVSADAGFTKSGLMIYVAAAYTAIRVATAIMNFLKAKRSDDYTLQTLRNVNLADGAVSVLSLQTAMFASFGGDEINVPLFNALTGAGVCLTVLLLGIYMIVTGNRKIKEWRKKVNE